MKKNIVDSFGLLGVGLTVISLRGDLTARPWGWFVMVVCGFFILGLSLGAFISPLLRKRKK
jgi:hypothetical protein